MAEPALVHVLKASDKLRAIEANEVVVEATDAGVIEERAMGCKFKGSVEDVLMLA